MTCELSILPGERIVLSRFSGPITVEDRVRNRRDTLQFCQERGIDKVLVDMRGQESLSDTMEIFGFGATTPETTRGFRIAIVYDPGDGDARFIGTVAANRGANIRLFHIFDQALEWLEPTGDKTPNKQDAGDGK
jgi:hypothetical protein